jgi:hypothetical protein
MIYRTDVDIYALVKKFEDRTLLKAEWTHAAHLTVGLYYCFHYSFGVARNLMRDGIYWLNDMHGTPNTHSSGYHETLTIFWLNKIAEFLKENQHDMELAPLARGLIEKLSDPELPLRDYSRERLFSAEARLGYIDPDLHGCSAYALAREEAA